MIRKCIKYHGAFQIPVEEFKTEFEKLIIEDIRLIDKSSIMNGLLVEDIETVIGISKDELAETHISDSTYEELTTSGVVNRTRKGVAYTPNRHFMSHVGFIYDMDDYSLLTGNWIKRYLDIYQLKDQKNQQRKEIIEKCAIKHYKKIR